MYDISCDWMSDYKILNKFSFVIELFYVIIDKRNPVFTIRRDN